MIQASGARKDLGGSCNDLPQGLLFTSLSDSRLAAKTAHVRTGTSASFPGQVRLSVGSAFPPKPQSTPKNSPLPMQTEPAPYCALWSCIVLPLVLHPSGKAYDIWLAAAKLLPTLRDGPYDRERGPDLKSEA